ncbi:MAG: flavin reductase family protein [Promethearchaeota archaeon]
MEKEIMTDIKKYQKIEKLKKWREQTQQIPWYFDGLENLCDRIHPGKIEIQISDIEELTHDTKLFRFISAKEMKLLPPFRAGQYIGLTVEINGVRTSRPYSIVSSPNQLAYYELGIKKKQDGFVSPYLFETARVGDTFEATEPLGELAYNPLFHGNDLVFIAGGVGITPFISFLRYITEKALPLNVWVIFGCLTEKDILFRKELEDIQSRRSNIKIKYILSEPDDDWTGACGFITKEEILDHINSPEKKYYYIVGNRDMYQFIQKELNAMGVPKHRAFFEVYGVPDDITQVIGWPDEIESSKEIQITIDLIQRGKVDRKMINARCTEPILNSLERAKELGIQIDSGCRSGQCALCRTRLVSGNVFVPPEMVIREVDQEYGFIHPCISYPISNIHIDLTLT